MKKFKMGPYGVELTEDQRLAVQGVIDSYNISDNPTESFCCSEEQTSGFVDEILIAIGCVKEPEGGF